MELTVKAAPKWPNLGFDIKLRLDLAGVKYPIAIGATGSVKNRDTWQEHLMNWATEHKIDLKFTRGRNRSLRTVAKLVSFERNHINQFWKIAFGIDNLDLFGPNDDSLYEELTHIRIVNFGLLQILEQICLLQYYKEEEKIIKKLKNSYNKYYKLPLRQRAKH